MSTQGDVTTWPTYLGSCLLPGSRSCWEPGRRCRWRRRSHHLTERWKQKGQWMDLWFWQHNQRRRKVLVQSEEKPTGPPEQTKWQEKRACRKKPRLGRDSRGRSAAFPTVGRTWKRINCSERKTGVSRKASELRAEHHNSHNVDTKKKTTSKILIIRTLLKVRHVHYQSKVWTQTSEFMIFLSFSWLLTV